MFIDAQILPVLSFFQAWAAWRHYKNS